MSVLMLDVKNKTILHSDLNSFFAAVECLRHPEIAHLPVAVCGDPAMRHGIVVAKNQHAKKYGIKTAEPIWQAKQKCPDLVLVTADCETYVDYAQRAREIYGQYTDQVEPYGLDEAWLDVGGSLGLKGNGKLIADEIRERIKKELNISVSIGVSFNKVFAKLGSDIKKPDATTIIDQENYRRVVWPLPVQELLYIGPSTLAKLNGRYIYTIGDLAKCEAAMLSALMGKSGAMLRAYARGEDNAKVAKPHSSAPPKSIGNSTTPPRDMESDTDAKRILYMLAESVAAQLREQCFRCTTVQISVRDNELNIYEKQTKVMPTQSSTEIAVAAFRLFQASYTWTRNVRSIGVRATDLVKADEPSQLSFLPAALRRQKQEDLEHAVDKVRHKFGNGILVRGALLYDTELLGYAPGEVDYGYSKMGYQATDHYEGKS